MHVFVFVCAARGRLLEAVRLQPDSAYRNGVRRQEDGGTVAGIQLTRTRPQVCDTAARTYTLALLQS